jgi:hypothetical protein
MSPLFYQPEPHGAAESDAYDALIAAGFSYTCRYLRFGPVIVCYYQAEHGVYRTGRHRSIRAVWAQVQADEQPC